MTDEELRRRLERAEARIEALKSENTNLRELNDAQLFAAAARVQELQEQNAAYQEIVEIVANFDDHDWCPHCERTPIRPHHPDCQVMKARAILASSEQPTES